MFHKQHTQSTESGFALLLTLIVVSVVISIGLSILDLSTKQIRLSTNAEQSEIAFHAANAGMECARYIRQQQASNLERGDTISGSCFTNSLSDTERDPTIDASSMSYGLGNGGEANLYEFDFNWPDVSNPRCTHVQMLVASSSIVSAGVEVIDMQDMIAGYPNPDITCDAGALCTVLSVRGYNKSCDDISSTYGTVEREVLAEF